MRDCCSRSTSESRRGRGSLPVAAALLLCVAACAGRIPHPGADDVTRAQQQWPGTTRADLERGRELLIARCAGCHTLYEPSYLPAERWPALVDEMSERARLSPDEAELVTRYLSLMSRR